MIPAFYWHDTIVIHRLILRPSSLSHSKPRRLPATKHSSLRSGRGIATVFTSAPTNNRHPHHSNPRLSNPFSPHHLHSTFSRQRSRIPPSPRTSWRALRSLLAIRVWSTACTRRLNSFCE